MKYYIHCSHHNKWSTWLAHTCTHKRIWSFEFLYIYICIIYNPLHLIELVSGCYHSEVFWVCVYVHLKVHQYSRKVVYIFYPLTKASEFKNIFLFLLPGHFFLSHFNFFNEFYVYFSALLSFYINETRELCSHSCLPIVMEVTFNFMGY